MNYYTVYGITGNSWKWFPNYLSPILNPFLYINGELSCFTTVSSGVPQGSTLDPLLQYINGIGMGLPTQNLLNYSKCSKQIGNSFNCHLLQEDLDSLSTLQK